MIYKNIIEGKFISRPNRFIANVELNGKTEICHVKNTGRCKELLQPGARVFLSESDNPQRKTRFDLIAVYKENILFNIDSQAPNKVFCEWLKESEYFENITHIKPECFYHKSRFDFYFEYNGKKAFAEVKGVTLENNGIFMFPDAPTERGVRHLNELCDALDEGYEAYAVFVLQAQGATSFMPNAETHPQFAEALYNAKQKGVKILCLDCNVTPDSLKISKFVSAIITDTLP